MFDYVLFHRITEVGRHFQPSEKEDECEIQEHTGRLQRMRSWLKRSSDDGERQGWRPVKRHRVSTKWWIKSKDNMLRTSTAVTGLVWCQPVWEVWWQWCRVNGVEWKDAPIENLLWEKDEAVFSHA